MACLTGCNNTLPEVEFSDECGGEVWQSEIEHIYMAKSDANDLVDVTDPVEWGGRLDQAAVVGQEIRTLTGIGEKQAAQPVLVPISKQRTKRVNAAHTLTFTIDDVSDKNYAAALVLQCGSRKKFWWTNRGGHIFGGNTGIVADLDVNPVHGSGDEIEKIVLTFTWKDKQDPQRNLSPL